MRFKNIIELANRLFYGNYNNIYIVDAEQRISRKMSDITLGELLEYNINNISGISCNDKNFYIKISK